MLIHSIEFNKILDVHGDFPRFRFFPIYPDISLNFLNTEKLLEILYPSAQVQKITFPRNRKKAGERNENSILSILFVEERNSASVDEDVL